MTSNRRVLTLEQKVWQYIRRNKKFVFSNVLLITSMNPEKLKALLDSYVKCNYIKRSDSTKSIMNSTYVVSQKLGLEPTVSADKIKKDALILQPLNKVSKLLENETQVSFSLLHTKSKLSNGSLRGIIQILESFKVLELIKQEDQIKVNMLHSNFYVDHKRLKTLLNLYKDRKVDELKELIKAKNPISEYIEVPEHLPQILEVITENEVLKRDELRRYAEVPRLALKQWWQILKNLGVIIDSYKETPKERVTYILSANRAKSILNHLNKGAYLQDKELKHLWMQ